jgi:hypothetical protein
MDYSLFKPVNGNRELNQLHLERIKKSMSQNCLFTILYVNEKHQIIDGQHRFEALKALGLPINYIVIEGAGLQDVQIYNHFLKKWDSDDYLSGYCELGYPEYLKYKAFKDRYQFGANETMALLTGARAGGGGVYNDFITGKFRVTNLSQATDVAQKIWMLEGVYDGFRRRAFVFAMMYLLGKPHFDFMEFLQKVKAQPTLLSHCNEAKQYVLLIEEVYNYRRREKVNLRF